MHREPLSAWTKRSTSTPCRRLFSRGWTGADRHAGQVDWRVREGAGDTSGFTRLQSRRMASSRTSSSIPQPCAVRKVEAVGAVVGIPVPSHDRCRGWGSMGVRPGTTSRTGNLPTIDAGGAGQMGPNKHARLPELLRILSQLIRLRPPTFKSTRCQ